MIKSLCTLIPYLCQFLASYVHVCREEVFSFLVANAETSLPGKSVPLLDVSESTAVDSGHQSSPAEPGTMSVEGGASPAMSMPTPDAVSRENLHGKSKKLNFYYLHVQISIISS